MTNCPNCGAPLEPYKIKCEYCGTCYFDLTMFDTLGDKPNFVKFRTTDNLGKEIFITALAKPQLKEVEVSCDTTDYASPYGYMYKRFVAEKVATISVDFICYKNPEDKTLFRVQVEERKEKT